ncbi:MAG: hypothetical protein EOP06_00655 [Proteobacteria bacterium]|nr:MAG: hypothetical protein EOP06_00655 [Pseudomonadota bacterium]
MHRLWALSLSVILPLLTSCSRSISPLKPAKLDSSLSSITTMISDDKISAEISSESTETQVVDAPSGSALAGISVGVRPGSFDRPVRLLLESGAAFGDSSILTEMPLGGGTVVQNSGGGVIIRPSESVNLKMAFQINLPAPQTTALMDNHYAIFYRYLDPATNTLLAGVKPVDGVNASLRTDGASGQIVVQFEGYFGIFWIVQVSKALSPENVPAPKLSTEAIVNKNQTAVIATTGIISEKAIVSLEILPALEIATPTLSIDTTKRRFSITGSPNVKARSCKAEVSENPKIPAKISVDVDSTFQTSGDVMNTEAHSLVGRFRCLDDNAKVAFSSWSNSVDIPAVVIKDKTPPLLLTVTPAAQSQALATNTKVRLTFSKAMDVGTLNGTNITLRNDNTGIVLPTNISYDADVKLLIVAPAQRLPADTTIRLEVKVAVKDSVGNALAQNFASTFKTEASGYVWLKGSNTVEDVGVRGTLGQVGAANTPSARWGSVFYIDENDQIHLYGGGTDRVSMSDMWTFNGKDWAWVGGDSATDVEPTRGTLGVEAPSNNPGARECASSFYKNGTLTLIGGEQFDVDTYADIWTMKEGVWTWIKGPEGTGLESVPGTPGVAAVSNNIGGVACAASAKAADGSVYLFGGRQTAADNDHTNQLWKFDGTNWTLLSGRDDIHESGSWGTKGIAAAGNHPSARQVPYMWIDKQSRIFIMGGHGLDSAGAVGILNDLWMFDGTNWTWLAGSDLADQNAIYGTKGEFNALNTPGFFTGGSLATDSFGQVWILGGTTVDNVSTDAMWVWNGEAWAWIGGSQSADTPPILGTQGVFSPTNAIGATNFVNMAFDSQDHLWIFGGLGIDVEGQSGDLNMLWRYSP